MHDHPASFLRDLGELPDAVKLEPQLAGSTDVMVCFVDSETELRKQFSRLAGKLAPDGMLWIAWPKRASGRKTDLSEDVVRNVGLKAGLVDVKVCAIDEVWSGLKFVVRLIDRPKPDRRMKDRPMKDRSERERPVAAKGKKSASQRAVAR